MRLNRLQLQNFKACRSVDLELAPLTVLIGANNAGKSSILHSIALQAQSVPSNAVVPTGALVDLGRALDGLVHRVNRADASVAAEVLLHWSNGSDGVFPMVVSALHIDARGDASTRVHVGLIVDDDTPATVVAADNRITVNAGPPGGGVTEEVGASRAGQWAFHPTSVYSQVPELQAALEQATPYLQRFVPEAVQRFRYVGANRHVESSVFPLGVGPVPNPRTAQELVDTLAYQDELLERVSQRCQSIFGYGVDKDLIPRQQVTLVAKSSGGPRNVVNLGTGFIQTVWLLAQLELALAQPPTEPWQITPLVGIEEPELHIHPGLQPDIARLLGAFAQAGLDLICTTQSEHLLLALLSLVLEGELSADQIVVYYLRDGEAERLAVDEQGRIEGGLRGFFEANEEQLRRHIELLKQRG